MVTNSDALAIHDGIGTYISGGHRIHRLVETDSSALYSQAEFSRRTLYLPLQFWEESVLPALQLSINERVSKRLIAAVRRAKSNGNLYERKMPGIPEICTEIFFDTQLCRPNQANLPKKILHEKITHLVKNKYPLKIGLPLFSRKPISPIKNRGYLPDLAEIASIGRCYELALILSAVYQNGVEFLIFADGKKYRRACLTPTFIIDEYQNGLMSCVKLFNASRLVKVLDYEEKVRSALGVERTNAREELYKRNYNNLCEIFSVYFDPYKIGESLRFIENKNDLGGQIHFTFNSIISSVFYHSGDLGEKLLQNIDSAQNFYMHFMKTISIDPRQEQKNGFIKNSEISGKDFMDLSLLMRQEAWDATLKYVAISITDRFLNIWKEINPHGIKFTIHAKHGEINFIHTSSEYKSMTAQHCVGGIKSSKIDSKITFEYRLPRETNGEYPVLLSNGGIANPKNMSIFDRLALTQQPICYMSQDINDPYVALLNRALHW